jgi:hypothetical protein
MYESGDFFERFRRLGRRSWRVTRAAGLSFTGLHLAVAGVLLPDTIVRAVAGQVSSTT